MWQSQIELEPDEAALLDYALDHPTNEGNGEKRRQQEEYREYSLALQDPNTRLPRPHDEFFEKRTRAKANRLLTLASTGEWRPRKQDSRQIVEVDNEPPTNPRGDKEYSRQTVYYQRLLASRKREVREPSDPTRVALPIERESKRGINNLLYHDPRYRRLFLGPSNPVDLVESDNRVQQVPSHNHGRDHMLDEPLMVVDDIRQHDNKHRERARLPPRELPRSKLPPRCDESSSCDDLVEVRVNPRRPRLVKRDVTRFEPDSQVIINDADDDVEIYKAKCRARLVVRGFGAEVVIPHEEKKFKVSNAVYYDDYDVTPVDVRPIARRRNLVDHEIVPDSPNDEMSEIAEAVNVATLVRERYQINPTVITEERRAGRVRQVEADDFDYRENKPKPRRHQIAGHHQRTTGEEDEASVLDSRTEYREGLGYQRLAAKKIALESPKYQAMRRFREMVERERNDVRITPQFSMERRAMKAPPKAHYPSSRLRQSIISAPNEITHDNLFVDQTRVAERPIGWEGMYHAPAIPQRARQEKVDGSGVSYYDAYSEQRQNVPNRARRVSAQEYWATKRFPATGELDDKTPSDSPTLNEIIRPLYVPRRRS